MKPILLLIINIAPASMLNGGLFILVVLNRVIGGRSDLVKLVEGMLANFEEIFTKITTLALIRCKVFLLCSLLVTRLLQERKDLVYKYLKAMVRTIKSKKSASISLNMISIDCVVRILSNDAFKKKEGNIVIEVFKILAKKADKIKYPQYFELIEIMIAKFRILLIQNQTELCSLFGILLTLLISSSSLPKNKKPKPLVINKIYHLILDILQLKGFSLLPHIESLLPPLLSIFLSPPPTLLPSLLPSLLSSSLSPSSLLPSSLLPPPSSSAYPPPLYTFPPPPSSLPPHLPIKPARMEKKGFTILSEFVYKVGNINGLMELFLNDFLNYINKPTANILNYFPLLSLYLKLAPNLFKEQARLEVLAEIGLKEIGGEEGKDDRRALGAVILQTIIINYGSNLTPSHWESIFFKLFALFPSLPSSHPILQASIIGIFLSALSSNFIVIQDALIKTNKLDFVLDACISLPPPIVSHDMKLFILSFSSILSTNALSCLSSSFAERLPAIFRKMVGLLKKEIGGEEGMMEEGEGRREEGGGLGKGKREKGRRLGGGYGKEEVVGMGEEDVGEEEGGKEKVIKRLEEEESLDLEDKENLDKIESSYCQAMSTYFLLFSSDEFLTFKSFLTSIKSHSPVLLDTLIEGLQGGSLGHLMEVRREAGAVRRIVKIKEDIFRIDDNSDEDLPLPTNAKLSKNMGRDTPSSLNPKVPPLPSSLSSSWSSRQHHLHRPIEKYFAEKEEEGRRRDEEEKKEGKRKRREEEELSNELMKLWELIKVEKNKVKLCLICRRKFASSSHLANHEKYSETHRINIDKNNLKNISK